MHALPANSHQQGEVAGWAVLGLFVAISFIVVMETI